MNHLHIDKFNGADGVAMSVRSANTEFLVFAKTTSGLRGFHRALIDNKLTAHPDKIVKVRLTCDQASLSQLGHPAPTKP